MALRMLVQETARRNDFGDAVIIRVIDRNPS